MITKKVSLVTLLVVVALAGLEAPPPSTSTVETSSKSTKGWDWKKNYADDEDDYGKGKYDNDDDDDDDSDYGQSKSRSKRRKTPDQLAHMNIYVREPSADGRNKKPSRFRMPCARYGRENFPMRGPFINYGPCLPIFADRVTRQTIIFTNGGLIILPPLINFYGKMFSVAELIASGYASLVSTGAPPPPAVNVAPVVQTGALVGPAVPTINPATGTFTGGVQTDFGQFRPMYPSTFEEEEKSPVPLAPSGGQEEAEETGAKGGTKPPKNSYVKRPGYIYDAQDSDYRKPPSNYYNKPPSNNYGKPSSDYNNQPSNNYGKPSSDYNNQQSGSNYGYSGGNNARQPY